MSIAFITDTHIGVRGSSSIFRELFRQWYRDEFFPYIKKHKIKSIIHAGDFFDSRTSVTLQDIDYIVNEWTPLLEDSGATMYVIPGNHDVAFKNTNRINSLSLLKGSNSVVVCDNVTVIETDGKNFVMCPWVNSENEEAIVKEISKYADDDHILVGHFEIQGALMYRTSPPCEHGFKPEQFKGFHKVLSGHFHHRSIYGNIEYLGAAFHYTWQDYNDWRGFHVYNPEEDTWASLENEYCLFTRFVYSDDLLKTSKEDLKDAVEGQFVQIVINDDYNKVDLKDFVNKIEKMCPISVDVIDKTILTSNEDQPEEANKDNDVKELSDYFLEFVCAKVEDEKMRTEYLDTLGDFYLEAKEKMTEIE